MNLEESKDHFYNILEEEKERIKYLFVDDSLVSNRITWDDKKVKVKYYTLEDFPKVPWYKMIFGIEQKDINMKNQELYEEAMSVALNKKLMPVGPPNNYHWG
jgi:hypothetical protein